MGMNFQKLRALGFAMVAMTMLAPVSSSNAALPAYCVTGPYIVYFDLGSDKLRADSHYGLDAAMDAWKKGCVGSKVQINGHTDTSKKEKRSKQLSQRRSQTVSAFLVKAGIPASSIMTAGYDSTRLKVQTKPDVSEVQNRRVEIQFIQAGG